VDLVEGTPVLDIKPYVPAYDSIPDATVAEWVRKSTIERREVEFEQLALDQLEEIVGCCKLQHFKKSESEQLRVAIHETLSVDVRSIHQEKRAKQTER
jgi:hypothetical protein